MEADWMRMALIGLGGLAVLGLVVWELKAHLGRRRHDLKTDWQSGRHEPRLGDLGVEPEVSSLGIETPGMAPDLRPESPLAPAESPLAKTPPAEAPPAKGADVSDQEASRRPAPESPVEPPANVEPLVLILYVHARDAWFEGPAVVSALEGMGLGADDMGFAALRDGPEGPILLRVASMAAPGTLPLDDPEGFRCPGLTLFTQVPGPKPGTALYAEMVTLAERLAESLEGEVRDETHSTLSRQTLDHARVRILEFERRLRLARGRS